MSDKPAFHRIIFGLASISVFITGIFYLLIGLIYGYFSYIAFKIVIIFGDTGDIIFTTISMIGVTSMFIFLGIYHGKIGVMFFDEESKIWKAYSKLIYIDAGFLFALGLMFLMGFTFLFSTVDSIDSENNASNSVISALTIASIPICISILHIFFAWALSNENLFGAIFLFVRNALRMTMIVLNAAFILSFALQFEMTENYLLMIFTIWIIIDGFVHMVAAGILIISAYIENYQSKFEDDDYDDLMSEYSEMVTLNPLEGYSREIEPDIVWQGEFREDGYEWIEFPQQSDRWFWRNEDGNWVQYD
tara:strand:+ start:136 stop:1050 length:915 start_codon:yes stop_codon:yes gene_type:complete